MNKFFTLFTGILICILTWNVNVNAQNDCSFWQQRDSTYGYVPFVGGTANYYRNDDGSTSAIDLPFTFCFWGQSETTVYINNNGNITFGASYAPYSPDTFPNTAVPPMIAPFWGDVDSQGGISWGGSDAVIYKITPHYMIVQWDSVGYFDAHAIRDQTCSFQVIISDGTDPIIPTGNNVSFTYKQMQWTTGDVSPPGTTGGFGGDPANVGANEGDGVRSIQIGLFDTSTSAYVGQYPPAPHYDGVFWLQNKAFVFNLCSGSVAPIISGVSPCDTFRICLGDSILIPIYFLAPLQGDSVWSNLLPVIPPGVSVVGSYPGPTDSLFIKVVGLTSNYGYHTINVYGYDNQIPADTTFTPFVIEIDSAPTNIHIIAARDTICAGDTSNLIVSGGVYYTWSNGATNSSITVTPATTQTYTATVSDGGCAKDTTITVYVLAAPTPSITVNPDSVCSGDSALLIASGGIQYTWGTGQTTDSIWVIPSTTTTYTLSASNGYCSNSVTKTVYIKAKVTAVASIRDSVICPHDTSYLSVTASGGSATYKWSNGATTSSISVSDSVTTNYVVTVYGVCDSVKLLKTVTVIPLPKPIIKGTSWKCHFIKDTLTVSNLTGDSTTYLWSNGSTKSTYYTGEIDADSTITVIAYNSLGCSDSTSFTITSRAVPNISISRPAAVCSGLPVEIVATATGTGPFTYLWEPGGETTDSISVASPGDSTTVTYTATVTNGCPASKVTSITAEFPVMNTISSQTISIGNDTVLWANGNSTKYDWQDSTLVTCLDPPSCDSVKVTPTVTTTYTVTGTDKAGCTVTGYVTITVDVPCVSFIVPNVFTPNYPGPTGYDNIFYIKTEHLSAWSIIILDRWGKEMYNSTNPYQYWTGTDEGGTQVSDGVYYYIITAVSSGNTCPSTTYKKEGFVQLIR